MHNPQKFLLDNFFGGEFKNGEKISCNFCLPVFLLTLRYTFIVTGGGGRILAMQGWSKHGLRKLRTNKYSSNLHAQEAERERRFEKFYKDRKLVTD